MTALLQVAIGVVGFALLQVSVELLRSRKPHVHINCGTYLGKDGSGGDVRCTMANHSGVRCTMAKDHSGVHAGRMGIFDVWWIENKDGWK